VRGPERPEQHRSRRAVAEREDERDPEHERQREREGAESERRASVGGELIEVKLEPGQEHQEQKSELAERLDDSVALDPTEDERPDKEPAEDDSDDAREAEPLDEERPQQDHGRRDEERPFRGRRGELDPEQHGPSL
jgi:hypothetical protein